MPSSPPFEDHQSKKESAATSSDPNHQPPPTPPPQLDGHPPPSGYPSAMWQTPQMGYPAEQYPVNYYNQPAYPNAPNQYAYAQPPPASYYNRQNNRERTEEGLVACVCLFACMFIFLTVVTGIASIITWSIVQPQIPCFHVEAMSVTNFNTSTLFTATWDVNVAVQNPNKKLKAFFHQIQCMVFYDGTALGSTYVPPFYMETKSKTGMGVRISTNGSAEVPLPIWVTLAMDKDRSSQGSVTFTLRCFMSSTLKNGWWAENQVMKVNCGDLKMDIAAGSESGKLAPEELDYCLVY
ncbi:hypothetical protein SLE2022_125080 [Rubroshorea leprosula]